MNHSVKTFGKIALTVFCLCVFRPFPLSAAIYYWDPEGTNSSATNVYTWDGSALWSTTSTLTTNLVSWSNGSIACFSAGPPTNMVVNVTNTPAISGLYNGVPGSPGARLVIQGGPLYLEPGQDVFTVNGTNSTDTNSPTIINSPLTGPGQLLLEGTGEFFLSAADSYTGGTQVGLPGSNSLITIVCSNGNPFGTGPITFAGGTNVLLCPGPAVTIPNAIDVENGVLAFSNSNPAVVSGPITGTGGLSVFTPSTLTLNGTNTYTGSTVINLNQTNVYDAQMTLTLNATASISNTSSIILGNGGLDVAAVPFFTLGSNTTLVSLGYGEIFAGYNISFGSQPLILNLVGVLEGNTYYYSTPLFVSGYIENLYLSNNLVTVTNLTGTALGIGMYPLIYAGAGAPGNIIGSPNPATTVLGAGIATNTAALIVAGFDKVFLRVTPAVTSPPQITSQLTSNAFQFSATVVPGAGYWAQSATNLTPPVTWTTLGTGVAATNGLIQFSNTNFASNSSLFYRLVFPAQN